jgi:TonB family protein
MSPATTIHTAEVLPPRAVLFLGIVAAHVLLAWFLGNGLIREMKNFINPRPVDVIPLPDQPVEVPRTQQDLMPPLDNPLYVPTPEVPVNPTYSETDSIMTTSVPQEPLPVAGPTIVAEPPPIRLVGRNVIPNSESYYPAQDRRIGREGTAEVQACVSPQGVLSSTPTVERSSGRTSLDQAAVRLVGDGRFARAMRGDEAVPNCYRFRVSFTMQ